MSIHSKCITKTRCRFFLRAAVLFGLIGISACQMPDVEAKSDSRHRPPTDGETVMLGLLAYNYTSQYIDNYWVDGVGGANVVVSSPATGGSKETCCVRWTIGDVLPVKVHIRWQSGVCIYTKRVDDTEFQRARPFYSEMDVLLTQPPPADPQYFETHFYPDGHVEVAITDGASLPRLELPRTKENSRPGAPPEPRCTEQQLEDMRREQAQ